VLRRHFANQIDAVVGRHDEPAIYAGEPMDPGIAGGPTSMSWEIHGDLASLLLGGSGAVVMELLHPSVMAGVFTQSTYRTEPFRRARATLGYVLRTTFGTTRAATRLVESVRTIHGRISGVRPDGVAYSALDPELLAWVHTCIPWAVMTAFERYTRPLSIAEKDRYLREQAVIGRLGGAEWVPETALELADYVERMRPRLAVTEQTTSFLAFMTGNDDDGTPRVSPRERRAAWLALHASMALMPHWARRLTGTDHPELVDRLLLAPSDQLKARLIRFAYPVLPCKQLALARFGLCNDLHDGSCQGERAPADVLDPTRGCDPNA
jgi:uncharacterized protein (DUF2236 family)